VATPMSPEDIQEFLERTDPALLGVVGTIRRDGSPHVVPVWYRYDGGAVHIWTTETRGWVRNLTRDSRVAFSVQEPGPPYAAVVLRGRAEVRTSGGAEISEEIRRITRRYIDEAEVEQYVAGWEHLRTIVTIQPDRISAWSRGY
jgi:PPOX class probable F420-dependent enzyme